jgi:glycosyltransferase involved in cell wall biosynthesis
MPLNASTANNVILEAIACGLPVVSSRLEGVRAYVPEEASILVENNDPKAFAEALLKLYRERNLREEMGRKARIRAVELSWDKISPRYEDFYRRVCEG